MAEVGVVASLIQIAAREQVDYIGKNVSYYSDVLELLVEQFEHERPIHSRKAVALAEKLYDHSYDLFERIRDLMPVGRRTRDQISFLQRIAWNFKKTSRSPCGEDKRSPNEKTKRREAARRQYLRAENVLVEWQRTQESLPLLQEAVEQDDMYSIQATSGSNNEIGPLTSERSYALVKSQKGTLAVIEAAAASVNGSESDKRALVLRNTAEWLEMLLDDWTVLSRRPLNDLRDDDTAWREHLSSAERRTAHRSRSSDRGENLEYLSAAGSQRRPEASGAHQQRMEREPERRREQGASVQWPTKRASQSERITAQESTTRSRESGGSWKMRSDSGDTDQAKADSRRYQYVEDDNGGEYEAELPFINSTSRPPRERGSEGEVHRDPFNASTSAPRRERGSDRELDRTRQRQRELNLFGSSPRTQAVQNDSAAFEIIPSKDERFNWRNPASGPGQQPPLHENSIWEPAENDEASPWGFWGPQRNNEGRFECTKRNCGIKGSRGFFSEEVMDGHLRTHDPSRPPFSLSKGPNPTILWT